MQNAKLLTISIPTWNRAPLLLELLDQIIFQIEEFNLESEIEIIISDNFSSDTTEKIVLALLQKYSYISYFKNNSNLGAKTNVIRSLFLANSKYVLLLGDDDRIRHNCLSDILDFLRNHPGISILIDECNSRFKINSSSSITLDKLLTNFYWYIGNAGLFICSTKYIKHNVNQYGYAFFNECWPQTQLMILGSLIENGEIYVRKLSIPIESKHNEVMIYTSFYLWRTCILELFNSVHKLQPIVPSSIFYACRNYMQSNIKQIFYNILQCGVFVDLPEEKGNHEYIYFNT